MQGELNPSIGERLARIESRLAALEHATRSDLASASWHYDTATETLYSQAGVHAKPAPWVRGTLRTPRACALCERALAAGEVAFIPPKGRSARVRHARVCLPCGESLMRELAAQGRGDVAESGEE